MPPIEVRFVPLPPENRAGYDAAIRWLLKLMQDKDDFPVCSECGSYLHVTTEGKQVCRNELCPNYS